MAGRGGPFLRAATNERLGRTGISRRERKRRNTIDATPRGTASAKPSDWKRR